MSLFLRQIKDKQVLVPILEAHFSAGKFPEKISVEFDTEKTKDTAFHPSSDTDCARSIYARHTGDLSRPRPTGSLQRTFQLGHLIHGWIQQLVVEWGMCSDDDVEQLHRITSDGDRLDPSCHWTELAHVIEPLQAAGGWWAQGAIDLANVEIPGEGRFIVDIKTVRGMAVREDNPFGSFREKYENQMQLYMDWTGTERAILLAFGKDSPHAMKEIIVEYDRQKVEAIYERWNTVAQALVADRPPACTCSVPSACDTKGLYGKALT